MTFKCYYEKSDICENISDPDYILVNKKAASKIARLVLSNEGDFFGLIDDNERIIQFRVNNDKSITVDMPVKQLDTTNILYHQKGSTISEVEEIIYNLPDSFEGLEFKLGLAKVSM